MQNRAIPFTRKLRLLLPSYQMRMFLIIILVIGFSRLQ